MRDVNEFDLGISMQRAVYVIYVSLASVPMSIFQRSSGDGR
jgi:hypothetical protein